MITPDAQKLLDEVSRAYKALPGYADEGVFTVGLKIDGKPRITASPIKVTVARPNKIAVDAGEIRLVGDGKTLVNVLVPTKRYFDLPSPETISPRSVADGPLGAVLYGGPMGQPVGFLLGLLLGDDPVRYLPDRTTGLRVEADRPWNGRTYNALVIDQGPEPGLRVLIDPASKLIHRIEFVVDPKALEANQPPEGKISDLTLDWVSGAISTATPKPEAFAFTPPAGFSKMTAADAAAPVAEANQKTLIEEMVGQEAPEFAFTAFDATGKTRKVTKTDLLGKVVLIDFWATWCGPCLEELPEIQKIVDKYAKEKKEVVFVILSQDDEPVEFAPLRKLIEKTFGDNKLLLGEHANTILGIDPEHATGDVFQVEVLPSVVLLGPDGKIQAAHVGIDYPVLETLTREIDILLGGKFAPPGRGPSPSKPKPARR